MNFTSLSILRLGIVVIASTTLWLGGTASAQRQTTSTADSPFLRSHDEPAKAKAKAKVVHASDKDAHFVSEAVAGGEQEVENGKMALNRAQSAEVKKVASRMVSDHTKANGELLAVAKKKGLDVTTGTIKAQKLGAKGFDKTYLEMVEQEHKAAIAEFEKEAKNGDDADLKAWAAKTLPTLRAHLAMVEDGLKQVK